MNNPDDQFEHPFGDQESFSGRVPMDIESIRLALGEMEVDNLCLIDTLVHDKAAPIVRHTAQNHDDNVVNSIELSVNFRSNTDASDATKLVGVLTLEQESELKSFKERLYSRLDNVEVEKVELKIARGQCKLVKGSYWGSQLYFVETYSDKPLIESQYGDRPVRTWRVYDAPPAEWSMVNWDDARLEVVSAKRLHTTGVEVVQKVAEYLTRLSYRFCSMHPMFWEVDDDRS